MISSISWKTFAPIDLGARLRDEQSYSAIGTILESQGWSEQPITAATAAIVGASTKQFARGSATFVLPPSGFAVLHLDGAETPFTDSRPFSPLIHLDRRRQRHRDLLSYTHSTLPAHFPQTVERLRAVAAERTSKHLQRIVDPRVFHYVMSVYFAESPCTSLDELPESTRRHLRACLLPSLLNLDDTAFSAGKNLDDDAALLALIDALDPDLSDIGDLDCSEETALLASWSSVFAVGDPNEDVRDLITALQVRVQSSWLAAWTVGDLARRLVADVENSEISRRQIDWLTIELAHLGSEATSRIDASASDRVIGVARGFESTSGLSEEWDRATRALEQARQYADLVNADANYRSQMAVEALLLIFAFASFAPIFLKLPIQSWEDVTSQVVAVVSLLALLGSGIFLIARRRR